MKKTCYQCKQVKDVTDFKKSPKAEKNPYRNVCKECASQTHTMAVHKSPYSCLRRRFVDLKRRARAKGQPVKMCVEDLFNIYRKQKGLCAITGLPMTWGNEGTHSNSTERRGTNISVDKIDPHGVYEPNNVRLTCERANKIKSNMTDNELYFWTRQISEKNNSFLEDE